MAVRGVSMSVHEYAGESRRNPLKNKATMAGNDPAQPLWN